MEFLDSQRSAKAGGTARLTVIKTTTEHTNWVSVSNPLANQLFDLNTLPVILQVRPLDAAGYPTKQTHYVAWTGDVFHSYGAPATSGGSAGCIGVPALLADALGLRPGTQVAVVPLPRGLPEATSVEVEPVGPSDWEVVEANAGFLEELVLQQVSVVSRGQVLPVWGRAGAAARLRVTATQPSDVVRLVAGCELAVAPKPRALQPLGGMVPQPQQGGPGAQGRGKQQQGAGGGKGGGGGGQQQQQYQQQQSTMVPLSGSGWPPPQSQLPSGADGMSGGGGRGGTGGGGGGGGTWPQQQTAAVAATGGRPRVSMSPRWGNGGAANNPFANDNGVGVVVGNGGAGPTTGSPYGNSSLHRQGSSEGGRDGLQAPPAWAGGLAWRQPPPIRSLSEQTAAGSYNVAATASGLAANGVGLGGAGTASIGKAKSGATGGGGGGNGSARSTSGADSNTAGKATAGFSGDADRGNTASPPPQGRSHGEEAGCGRGLTGLAPAATTAVPSSTSVPSAATNGTPQKPSADGAVDTPLAAAPPRSESTAPSQTQMSRSDGPASVPAAGNTVRQPPAAASRRPMGSRTHSAAAVQPLRLRVLDPPPSKYLVQLPYRRGSIRTDPVASSQETTTSGNASAAAPSGVVMTWLTLAVAVAPETAAMLTGGGSGDVGGGAVVRLQGRGSVRDLLGVLVPEPCCPRGHVMLSPPLQHVLCVLPHMAVTVLALPLSPAVVTAAAAGADIALAALPGITLHPLPLPPLRLTGGGPGTVTGALTADGGKPAGGGSVTSAAAAGAQQQGGEGAGQQHQAALAALANGSGGGASAAVLQWLAAQMDGIAHMLRAERRDGNGGEDDVDVVLPVASGAVVHFSVQPPGIGIPAAPQPGDYCLIVHAVRRNHATGANGAVQSAATTAAAAAPPLFSSRMLTALLETKSTTTQTTTTTAPVAPPLATKLGQPVILPSVSYTSSRHGNALAVRTLPPPPQLRHIADRPPPSSVTQAFPDPNLQERNPNPNPGKEDPKPTQIGKASSQQAAAALQGPSALGLDLGHISWLAPQFESCLRRLLPQLNPWVSAAAAAAGLPRCGGVLVTGPPGSGRSQLLSALGDLVERHPQLQAHVLHVRCGQMAGGSHTATTTALASFASEALSCAPCLLLLDDLDALCPSAAEGSEYGTQHPEGTAAAARLADWLAALMDELAAATAAAVHHGGPAPAGTADAVQSSGLSPPVVAVAAAAKDAAALHAVLRRVGRLDFEVRLPAPGSAGRAAMLAAAARQRGVEVAGGQLAAVAAAAEGFEGVDLKLLLDRAVHNALRRQLTAPHPPQQPQNPDGTCSATATSSTATAITATAACPSSSGGLGGLAVTEADLRSALEDFVPAAFWGVQQAAAAGAKAEGWEVVGGLHDVVASLREALTLPIRHRALVAGAPLRLRTGALLYGPPGCGKTHVVAAAVAAVAKMAPVRFLSVKGPELLNKYIGASEAAVRDLFARAAAAAPAVLFFDEFDAIAPPRGHDSTGVTDRVVNQLLTELDGVEGLRGVVVLAATSRPDMIDAALLRPGRLDRLLYCGPPEGPKQRLEILRALSRRLHLAPDVDLKLLAERTTGMTGADLGAVLSEAQLHAINEMVPSTTTTTTTTSGGTSVAAATAATASLGGSGPSESGSGPLTAGSAAAGPKEPMPDDDPAAGSGSGGDAGYGSSETPSGSAAALKGPLIAMRHVQRALAGARPSLPAAEAARLASLYERFQSDRAAPPSRPGPGAVGDEGGSGGGGKRATLA